MAVVPSRSGWVERDQHLIQSISPKEHDLLLQVYWQKYHAVFPVVDKAAFEASLFSSGTTYRSHVLHFAVLAMGLHLADDMSLGGRNYNYQAGRDSFGHHAKQCVWEELDDATVATAAGLIILSELEFHTGDAALGRRFSGTFLLPVGPAQQTFRCQFPSPSSALTQRRDGTSNCTGLDRPSYSSKCRQPFNSIDSPKRANSMFHL